MVYQHRFAEPESKDLHGLVVDVLRTSRFRCERAAGWLCVQIFKSVSVISDEIYKVLRLRSDYPLDAAKPFASLRSG